MPHLPKLPRLPSAILRALLPRAERDEVLADIAAEYDTLRAACGERAAESWLWRQALRSAPGLFRLNWFRGFTGFEPNANSFRPGDAVLKTWMTDVRYAARRLRVRPTYAAIAILTLALGIGGTAAIFGIARPVLWSPLPYTNADRVGMFWMPGWWTEEEYLYMRDKFAGFQSVAAYAPRGYILRAGDEAPRIVSGYNCSYELFDVLGAHPLLGRGFQRGDDVKGAAPVAVISHGLWQELGGTDGVLGKQISVDGIARTVVGVMPRGFWFPDPEARIWLARALDPQGRNGSYALIGLAPPGQNPGAMSRQIGQITQAIGERFHYSPRADKTKDAIVKPLRLSLLGPMRPAVTATLGAMVLILLIACANVAALMLGQVEGRSSEMAVRTALGATRARLVQQVVAEALLVGVAAGAVGAGLAASGFHMMANALPLGAWGESASFDWSLFGAALAIAVAAALAVVLVPVISLWRSDVRDLLSRARAGGIHGRGGRMERGLVVAEVALAMLIVSGAALLVRSVANLYAIEPGVTTKGIAVVDFVSNSSEGELKRTQTVDAIVAALAQLPGVQSASAAMKVPLRGGGDSFGITVEGKPGLEQNFTYFRIASPNYLQTMGIRLLSGRTFDASDRMPPDAGPSDSAEIAVVVNEALAKKYFPGENPLGKRLGGGFKAKQRIIGVVADVAEATLTEGPQPARYYSYPQVTFWGQRGTLVLRLAHESDAAAVLEAARRTVQRVAPNYAVQGTTTMQHLLDAAIGPARQVMTLLGILSGLALILGAVGVYGVISHFASRRKRDWAIRVALGMTGSGVARHIVGQGVSLVVVGVVLGGAATLVLSRFLAALLFEVKPGDLLAFGSAAVASLVIGVIASSIPARRAATVDPAVVLREE